MKLSLVCLALCGLVAYTESRQGIEGAIEHDEEMWRQQGYLEAVVRENGLKRTKRERDLIRERAKANYDKVVQELNDRFRNYKDNCFPRPRGCVCVVRQDKNGRDITKRVLNDADCKSMDPKKSDPSRGVHDSRDRLRGKKRKNSGVVLRRSKRFHDDHDHAAGHSADDGHDHSAHENVQDELEDRVSDYREGCFPKPKGCSCTTTDENGETKTERILNDEDCKIDSSEEQED